MIRILLTGCIFLSALVLETSAAGASVPGLPFTSTACEEHSDSVARLYTAGLGRVADQGGFEFWLDEYTSGRWTLPRMAAFFESSDEFKANYGALSDLDFVKQVYRNVLQREGDAGGIEFWTGQIGAGTSRGTILLRFSESPENITITGTTEPALGPYNQGLLEPFACGSPGDIKNCGDFSTQAEAQGWHDRYFPQFGDISKLDQDGNGVACESLPS